MTHAERSFQKRGLIIGAVIDVLAEYGIGGLTHRRVAIAAGVSLSATTYHYETKSAMLADASERLLDGYLSSFRRLAEGQRAGRARDASLGALVARLAVNAAGRHHQTSLAWCEIMIDAARTAEGHQQARQWYAGLEEAWRDLAMAMAPATKPQDVSIAIDISVGLLFIVLPLGLDTKAVETVRAGNDPICCWGLDRVDQMPLGPKKQISSPKAHKTRARILDGAIAILNRHGAGGISYKAVAKESGVALTAPAYHFGSIAALIRVAETELFKAAKRRYREMQTARVAESTSVETIADLTSAIFIREATEYGRASLGHYSVWLEAARNETLRSEVAAAVRDQAFAWERRLAAIAPATTIDGIIFQALFIGRLIRVLACGRPLELLAETRYEFLAALTDQASSREGSTFFQK